MSTPGSDGQLRESGLTVLGHSGPEGAHPYQVVVGLGNPERERLILPVLRAGGDFAVIARCLGAEQLLEAVRSALADVALVAFDLHQLTSSALGELARERTPLVLLVPRGDEARCSDPRVTVLPLDSAPDVVRQVLLAAVHGERNRPVELDDAGSTTGNGRSSGKAQRPVGSPTSEALSTERTNPVRPGTPGRASEAARVEALATAGARSAAGTAEAPAEPGGKLAVLGIASGIGSPGRSLVALNLACALGSVAPTVLVEADLDGPSLAAYLGLDPTRNVSMLAHAEPATAREWDQALDQELQPLDARSPLGRVLCGVPKPEMRAGVSARFFEKLVSELRARYRYVVLDVGADLAHADSALHRTALALADQVLLVASADLVGLWRARSALALLEARADLGPERIALVVNRHDRRQHQARSEIEWALGVGAAAVIPFDHEGVQRALSLQRPLVLERRSPAGRALIELADRIHGGRVRLPPEPGRKRRLAWVRLPKLAPARWLKWRPRSRQSPIGGSRGSPPEAASEGRGSRWPRLLRVPFPHLLGSATRRKAAGRSELDGEGDG